MELIKKYYKDLTEIQLQQFAALDELYHDWNNKINVISRKDIDNLYEHHVLHSLAISRVLTFKEGTSLLDVGTGGGFPGIPLAILFPTSSFYLVDSIGKKVKVASEIASAIGLKNVTTMHCRDIIRITKKNIEKVQQNALPNGWICLKGGELEREIDKFKSLSSIFDISSYYEEDYFKEKKVVYVPYMG